MAGLYTGLLEDTCKTIADSFLFFLAYNFLRQSRLRSRNARHLPAFDELGVGFLAGAFTKLITTPISNVVTRKQTSSMLAARENGKTPAKSATVQTIAAQIRSEKGLMGFWSGYSACLVLTLNPSITFFLFETFKRTLLPRAHRDEPSPQATFLIAAISKAIASSITYPFSLAKARAQSSSKTVDDNYDEVKEGFEKASNGATGGTRPGRIAVRRTVFSTILHIAQTEGISALYEGLGGEVLKGFFSHGITMLVKDAVHTSIIKLYYALLTLLNRARSHPSLVQSTKDQATTSYDAVKAAAASTHQKGQSLAQNGSAHLATAYDSAKAAAQDMGSSAQTGVANATGQAFDAGSASYEKLKDLFAESTAATRAVATNTASAIQASATESSAKASDAAGHVSASLQDAGAHTVQKGEDVARGAYGAVGETAAGVVAGAGRKVDPVMEVVGGKIEGVGRALRTGAGRRDGGGGEGGDGG